MTPTTASRTLPSGLGLAYPEWPDPGPAIVLLSSRISLRWMEDTIHDIPLQRPDELAEQLGSLG